MKSTNWKDIAELAGITAIVLSLIFVGLQLRQYQQLATEELVNFSNERQNAIRELIVANAEVWHKACAGEPLAPVSRVIAGKIYDAWTDHVVGEYFLRLTGVRQSESARETIIEEYAAQHWIYPGLKELAMSRDDWDNGAVKADDNDKVFRETFFGGIQRRLDELEASDIEPEGDIAWCGRT
jgi:hypothetical protein